MVINMSKAKLWMAEKIEQLLATSMDIAFAKTDSVCNSIGVRKAPRPERCAGFVRIDSAHQGDEDGMKGAYHIAGLDCIAPWQVESCVEGIGKAIFRPV